MYIYVHIESTENLHVFVKITVYHIIIKFFSGKKNILKYFHQVNRVYILFNFT